MAAYLSNPAPEGRPTQYSALRRLSYRTEGRYPES